MGLAKNVFLVGPMGVGKSTVGRHLADLLGMRFLDSDQEIERRTGVSIPWIFEIEGEDGFRHRESQVITELASGSGVVLATGGGAVLSEVNRVCLSANGFVVYLEAGLDTLMERTRRDRHRPLLQTADPRSVLDAIVAVRRPLYVSLSDLVVSTEHRSAPAVAREIATHIQPKAHENALG